VLDRREEIEALKAAVLLVAYDEPSLLEAKMMHHLELPFPLALDRDRTAYTAWGLGGTNLLGAMLSPSLNWRYFRLLLAGERFLGFAPDMFQLGGDFVIDADGRLAAAFRPRRPDGRPSIDTLIGAVRAAAVPPR
jgi:AhpC/TSA antioxidant enzyme